MSICIIVTGAALIAGMPAGWVLLAGGAAWVAADAIKRRRAIRAALEGVEHVECTECKNVEAVSGCREIAVFTLRHADCVGMPRRGRGEDSCGPHVVGDQRMTPAERERAIKARARNALKDALDRLHSIKGQADAPDPQSQTRADVSRCLQRVIDSHRERATVPSVTSQAARP